MIFLVPSCIEPPDFSTLKLAFAYFGIANKPSFINYGLGPPNEIIRSNYDLWQK